MSKKLSAGITRLGPDRYRVRVTATIILPGTERKKLKEVERIVTAMSVEEVEQIKLDLLAALKAPPAPTARRMTVAGFAEEWLSEKKPIWRKGTYERAVDHLGRFIAGETPDGEPIGAVYMDLLTPEMIKHHLKKEAETLSGYSCAGQLTMIRMMTKDAHAELRLERQPCDRVKLPKRIEQYADDENCLSAMELQLLWEEMRQTESLHFPLFATMATTGLRFCEAHALQWSDLDLEAGTCTVVRSRYRGQNNPPKTPGSRRRLALAPELIEELKTHRAHPVCLDNPLGLVFTTTIGTYQDNGGLNHAIHRAAARAGITKRFTVHGLRRTMNTLALQVANAEVVRKVLGHSTAGMTQHYLGVGLDAKRELVEGVAKLISDAKRPAMGTGMGTGVEEADDQSAN